MLGPIRAQNRHTQLCSLGGCLNGGLWEDQSRVLFVLEDFACAQGKVSPNVSAVQWRTSKLTGPRVRTGTDVD
jgi:hypothetical protein